MGEMRKKLCTFLFVEARKLSAGPHACMQLGVAEEEAHAHAHARQRQQQPQQQQQLHSSRKETWLRFARIPELMSFGYYY